MTKQEQEIEEMAQIVHKTLSFDIGPVNDADRKDALEILSLINQTHVRKDTEVRIKCFCVFENTSTTCECQNCNNYITKTIGELVERKL